MSPLRRIILGPGPLRILVIGAHADDIEIGAGGTILRLLAEHAGSALTWVVASAEPERAHEARASAEAFGANAGSLEVHVGDLPDGRFPNAIGRVKDLLEAHKEGPLDLILGPHAGDAHQDHRTVAEVIAQTFRHHLTLGYEIAKYDGDLGHPNVYVDLEPALLAQKITLLDEYFPSQHTRPWWDAEAFRALPRLRGIEVATHYAEAFHGRKLVL